MTKTFNSIFTPSVYFKFESVEAVHAEEPFLLNTEIRCTSPWPIEINNSSLTLVIIDEKLFWSYYVAWFYHATFYVWASVTLFSNKSNIKLHVNICLRILHHMLKLMWIFIIFNIWLYLYSISTVVLTVELILI